MRESITLLPEPCSAGEARHFVEEHLRHMVADEVAQTAVLLTSELVTNVIVHARTPLRLDVQVDHDALRVAVVDEAPRSPTIRQAGPARLTGRGMALVETLATQWGVEPTPPGKTVWFELIA